MTNQLVCIPILELEDGKRFWSRIRGVCETIGTRPPKLLFPADKLPEQRRLLAIFIQKIRESNLPDSARNSVVEFLSGTMDGMYEHAGKLIRAGLPTDISAMRKIYKAAPNGIAQVFARAGDPESMEIRQV